MKLAPTIHQPTHHLRLGHLTTMLLLAVAATGLPACDQTDPTGTDLTSSAEGGQGPAANGVAADASAASVQATATTLGTIPLPINQTVTTDLTAFSILQKGIGGVGVFKTDNPSTFQAALKAETNSSTGDALYGRTIGTGNAVHGQGAGPNSRAAFFENPQYTNPNSALAVRTMGPGTAGVFLAPNGGKGMFINSNSNAYTLEADNSGTGFAAKFYGNGSAKGVYIETHGGAGLQVVGGTKNAVVRTPSGARELYTEESSEVWFTDYGFGKLEHGRARILFDPSFAQTINPNEPYHVFLQSYGDAELYVRGRTPLGFEVALGGGDPNAAFSYRVVAKRLGFEQKRLEPAPWADRPSW